MSAVMRSPGEVVASLLRRVTVTPTGCWEIAGYRTKKGYVLVRCNGRKMHAHRLMWFIRHRELPSDVLVCHECDNPSCINPSHCFEGTTAVNNADRDAKGRAAHLAGEQHGRAVLTDREVADIRSLYAERRMTQRQLAHRFGIAQSHVWRLVHGRNRLPS